MKPFLVLQLREVDAAADGEFEAFLRYGGLTADNVHRVRMEREGVPQLNLDNFSGVLVGGGPTNVSDTSEEKTDAEKKFEKELALLMEDVLQRDFPYLGMCYGLGFLVKHCGGNVAKAKYAEPVGAVDIILTKTGKDDPLLQGLPGMFKAIVGHKEACQTIPDSAALLAAGRVCPHQMIRIKNNVYGTQFHPELDAEGAAVRVDIYKHAGYFPPEDAEKIKSELRNHDVSVPPNILRRFVERYKQ